MKILLFILPLAFLISCSSGVDHKGDKYSKLFYETYKDQMHDPSVFEFISSEALQGGNLKDETVNVYIKFRGLNALGAKIISERYLVIEDGKLVNHSEDRSAILADGKALERMKQATKDLLEKAKG